MRKTEIMKILKRLFDLAFTGILLAVAARGLYIMIERKDYSIAFCFTAVLCFSIYMVLVSLGFLPAPE